MSSPNVRRVVPSTCAVPAEELAPLRRRAGRRRRGPPSRSRSGDAGPSASSPRRPAQVTVELAPGARVDPDGAGGPGGPVRARRTGAAGLERADERRPGAGRRGGESIAVTSPQQGVRRAAAPGHPGAVPPARRRGGVRRRRRPGDRHVRPRGRGALRPGRPGHRPGQHLRGRRQAAAPARVGIDSEAGPDRDRDPGRRRRRPRPTWPPT